MIHFFILKLNHFLTLNEHEIIRAQMLNMIGFRSERNGWELPFTTIFHV